MNNKIKIKNWLKEKHGNKIDKLKFDTDKDIIVSILELHKIDKEQYKAVTNKLVE